MDNLPDGYRVGQIVVSKRGKDAGHTYVIAGFLDENRLALADARRFNVSRPKSKNPRHVQATSRFVDEKMVVSIEGGRDIDHGELRRFLASSKKASVSEQRGRVANGK
ncbi:MAG: KOW domain-containing RNA-binding protein [Synergistaceae bacterium]|jgi:ribosomal protein L14E/L6E/L27E|nr:KOW domain-containing RNA-binding protein [Synergistaceae bacterium]